MIFFVIGIVVFLLVLATYFLGNIIIFFAACALFIVIVAILGILASAMHGIFVVVLYRYAKTGQVPATFNRELIEKAFTPKSQKLRGGNI